MKTILETIYSRCNKENVRLVLSAEAQDIYESYHDSIVDFRKEDAFEEAKLSIKSKPPVLLLRISGIISLLRVALTNNDTENLNQVEESDINMALKIVEYSINNAFALLPKNHSTTSTSKK